MTQQQQDQEHEGRTENGRKQEPEPSRDATVCVSQFCCECSRLQHRFGSDEVVCHEHAPDPDQPRRYTQTPDGCWVACIAGLTDIPHDELAALVPRHEGRFDGSMGTEYRNAVNSLLRSRGWRLEGVGPDVPRGFGIASGTSPRGLFHAVIVRDGALWHDPHPSREGLVSRDSFEVVVPIQPVATAAADFARWQAALSAETDASQSPAIGTPGDDVDCSRSFPPQTRRIKRDA